MKLTFKQFLNEAKYAGQTSAALIDRLTKVVWDAAWHAIPGDYKTQDEYVDDVLNNVVAAVEATVPIKFKEMFSESIWSAYHELDSTDFHDAESFIDAMLNEITREIRWLVNNKINI